MYTTQQIIVKKGHRMHRYFDDMCANAKNLFNASNFYIRQVYTALRTDKSLQPLQHEVLSMIHQSIDPMNATQRLAYQKNLAIQAKKPVDQRKEVKFNGFEVPNKETPYLSYPFLNALFKQIKQPDYRSLPVQSSQQVMKSVFECWKSYYSSLRDYQQHPHKYKGRPGIPKYVRKDAKEVTFTNQDCVIKDGKYLKFPKTKDQLNIGKLGAMGTLKEVIIIPTYNYFVVTLVFKVNHVILGKPQTNRHMAIDLGIDNLATIVTNTGRNPAIVKGKTVKSVNQFYNKRKAHLLSILRHGKETNQGSFTTKRLQHLHETRHRKLKDLFHQASAKILNMATTENIDTIIIGQNKGWKQEINIGKRNNQSFTSIPHSILIRMITYKAEALGMGVIVNEESYTSKASFVDGDDVPVYPQGQRHSFSGKRLKRGLYRSKHGSLINADVNGAANILRKAAVSVDFNMETVHVWNPVCV